MTLESALFKQIQGIKHAFGTRGENFPVHFKAGWDMNKPTWKQVHGARSCEVKTTNQACGEVDALFTFEKNLPIAVVSADCVPILLAKKDGTGVAAIHSGWRGTKANIVSACWQNLAHAGETATHWVAAIGPAIGPCCYEVSAELAHEFGSASRYLDLPEIVSRQLCAIGISAVDRVGSCTRCSQTLNLGQYDFESYRREHADGRSSGREYSVIERII